MEASRSDRPVDSTRSMRRSSVIDRLDVLLPCLLMASPPWRDGLKDEQGDR